MVRGKNIRERGKIRLSGYFQDLNEGDFVSVVREKSFQPPFQARLQGKTGMIIWRRGRYYLVKIREVKMEKTFLIEPIHLKKIK